MARKMPPMKSQSSHQRCSRLEAMNVPIVWMLSTSFKPLADVFSYPPQFIPRNPTVESYTTQFTGLLGRYFLNSVIVGLLSAILATGAGALAAYLAGGGRKIDRWVTAQKHVIVDFDDCPQAFANINTPDELAQHQTR